LKRTPEDAPVGARLRKLEDDLPKLDGEDHQSYAALIIGEMKRELRLWRDCYWDYLDSLNRASRTIKRRIGVELAVAPAAAIRLAQRGSKYLAHSHVDPSLFNLIFVPQNLVCIHLDGAKCAGHPETSIEDMMTRLVPQSSFRKLEHKQGFMVGGPFAIPPVPRPESMMLHELNQVWISSLCRMWDEVVCEVMTQYFLIDLDERVSALRAAESFTEFQRSAGTLYLDYIERYGARLPEQAWNQFAEIMDQKSFPLKDNLESMGKKALADAIVECGHEINTWAEALAFRATNNPAARFVQGFDEKTDRYLGDLTRHAKKTVYRAKEAVEETRKERTS
jgi:hypothetical protein